MSVAEIIRCIGKVNHPSFKSWCDAGNLVYYTGKGPIEQLKLIVPCMTGFCAKDCAGVKGQIWLDFGKGKVHFQVVFKRLKESGFNGSVMVRCCAKGSSLADIAAGATRNREQLQKWFAEL